MNAQVEVDQEQPHDKLQAAAVSSDDEAAYADAVNAHQHRVFGAAYAHGLLRALSYTGVALVLSVGGNLYLGWKAANPDSKYFTTEGGKIQRVFPLDKPAFTTAAVSAFGADTIRGSFSLDFVHYKQQISGQASKYDDAGYQDYYKALTSSNVLAAVRDQRMNLSVDVGPGVLRKKGQVNGLYAWEMQWPVTLKLDGQTSSSLPQRFYFTQRIQQADVRVKPSGLEVTQVITSSAN